LANVPRSEPSTGLARCAFVDLVRDLARPAVDGSDDTPSARDDGLAWFKTALGAFAYDKGYRQAFSTLGFPGPDAEYLMALSQLRPARRELDEADAAILDVSCGPGMFAEMFARGSEFPHVVATDYSHAMCARTRDRIMGASVFGGAAVVRADVGDLPFADGSLPGLSTQARGAHCWPDSEAGLRAKSRAVLRPRRSVRDHHRDLAREGEKEDARQRHRRRELCSANKEAKHALLGCRPPRLRRGALLPDLRTRASRTPRSRS
jgi:SAM-dependent methyltransferase